MAPDDNKDVLDESLQPLDESFDPLAGLDETPSSGSSAEGPGSSGAPKGPKKGLFGSKKTDSGETEKPSRAEKREARKQARMRKKGESLVRIEDADDADDEDTDRVISMYLPRRRLRLLARALLRLDKMRLALLLALILIIILFLLSFLQEKMGSFTINLDRLELFRKGIAIDYDPYFSNPTARLTVAPVKEATNISINDLPLNIDEIDGEHNGINYMAYTYYLRNAGKEDVGYVASINLVSASKDADNAVRVAVWHNGERTVYAQPSADGETPEPGCENFYSDTVVCRFEQEDFQVGYVDKYTVVVWLEGDDPECVDAIVGGAVEFVMKITASNEVETTLLQKYIQDIKDTLAGTKPINPAGTVAPDFQKYEDVTWFTRRNQDGGESQGVNIN